MGEENILWYFRFSDKTKNDFYHRDTFTKYPGKYDYVQLDYNPSVRVLRNHYDSETGLWVIRNRRAKVNRQKVKKWPQQRVKN